MVADEVDGLFRLPLAEFTAARNALASRLKASGDAEESARVKALSKPPVSAWAVNQLYWQHDTLFSRLMTTSHRLTVVQTEKLAGRSADLRTPLDARNAVIADLMKAAAALLERSGYPAAPDTLRRVVTTLEALAAYGRLPGAPEPGRLTRDVDPPGFAALAALMPGKPSDAPSRVIAFSQPDRSARGKRGKEDDAESRRRKLAEARTARQEAERALAQASRDAAAARAAMREAAAQSAAAEKRRAALATQMDKLTAAAEAMRQQARRVAEKAEAASLALDDAEQAAARARAAEKEAQSSSRP